MIEPLLSLEDIILCNRRSEYTNILMFGIMLAYYRQNIKFPSGNDGSKISDEFILQISDELKLANIPKLAKFTWSNRTAKRYRRDIRLYLGYKEATELDGAILIEHIVKEILPHAPSD